MCDEEGCERDVHARGLCQNHYRKALRRERGLKKPGPAPDPTKKGSRHNPAGTRSATELVGEAATHRRSSTQGATDEHCTNGHPWVDGSWYWQKNKNYANGRRRVCRLCARNWQTKYKGREPIPDDVPIAPKNADKTHCKQGHEYTEENTLLRPDGSRWCRKCQRQAALRQRLKRYSLDEEQFRVLLERSDGRCEICGADEQHIDHCHETGAVRGILCNNCNNGLGRFSDDPERLRAALRYLEAQSSGE